VEIEKRSLLINVGGPIIGGKSFAMRLHVCKFSCEFLEEIVGTVSRGGETRPLPRSTRKWTQRKRHSPIGMHFLRRASRTAWNRALVLERAQRFSPELLVVRGQDPSGAGRIGEAVDLGRYYAPADASFLAAPPKANGPGRRAQLLCRARAVACCLHQSGEVFRSRSVLDKSCGVMAGNSVVATKRHPATPMVAMPMTACSMRWWCPVTCCN